MLELLDRTLGEPVVEHPTRTSGTGPPKAMPPIERDITTPWPRRARIVTAALAVIAIAGVLGTAVQLLDDDATDETQITELTGQRDDALDANRQLQSDVDRLESDLDGTTVELATARLDNSTITAELAAADTRIDELTADNIDLTTNLESTVAERDALLDLFPMAVDTSLVGVDLVGTYDVDWIPAYNSGLADITLPGVRQVAIRTTAEGWLRVDIPGVVTADLSRTDGALFTMVDTTTAVPAVDGVARVARVAITIYAGDVTTAADGSTTVTELGMSVAISTPTVTGAPAGVALYGAELTPQR